MTSLLLSDFELKKAKFDQRPYYRLLVSWLEQLPSDPNLEPLALYVQVFGASLVKVCAPLHPPLLRSGSPVLLSVDIVRADPSRGRSRVRVRLG